MKYTVSLAIDGRVDVDVDADNAETAKDKALGALMDIDVGNVELIHVSAVNATDENDNLTDY